MVSVAVALPVGASVAGLFGVGLVAAVFTHVLFLSGWILSTSEVLLAATCVWELRSFIASSRPSSGATYFRHAVSLFVSKRVAASLDDSSAIGLSGKLETVTILFTDIRGFTAYSERVCEEQDRNFWSRN